MLSGSFTKCRRADFVLEIVASCEATRLSTLKEREEGEGGGSLRICCVTMRNELR